MRVGVYQKIFLLAVLIWTVGCKKDKNLSGEFQPDPNCTYVSNGRMLTNPYVLNGGKTENGKLVEANHLYIKILVENQEELNALEQIGQFLPFEWNREPQFDLSHEINTESNGIWMYGVIPTHAKNKVRNVVVLDELYYPEKGDGVYGELYGSELNNGRAASAITGSVKFKDPIDHQYKSLQNIKVIIKDGGKMIETLTDESGAFYSNQKIASEKAEVLLKFDNNTMEIRTLDMKNLALILSPNTISLGVMGKCAFQQLKIEIDENTKSNDLYYSVSAYFAYQNFRKFASENGYGVPEKKLNIWVAKDVELSSGYAAPMLRHVGSDKGTKDLLVKLFNLPANIANNLANLIKKDLPDVYAPYENADPDRTTPYNIETLYHEFGHSTQYTRVGNAFWTDYIEHIFNNGGYGNGGNVASGLVAMSESWAEDFSFELLSKMYGTQKYPHTDRDRNIWSGYRWIPVGIYYDLHDEDSNESYDQVSGFTFPELYQIFGPEVRTPQQFRDRLFVKYPAKAEPQRVAIHALFKLYGYE